MKFLIVEDEPTFSRSLRCQLLLFLPSIGSEIRHCLDVKKALIEISESPPDFVFLAKPRKSSHLFPNLKTLRAATEKTPIVVIAEKESSDLGKRALLTGADDSITLADFSAKNLKRVIVHAVARSHARTELLDVSVHAQQATFAKSAFLANMSHEIRTPLNLIIGTADLLHDTPLSPQQKKLVSTFSTASDHLLTLLSNVLDLSHLDARGLHCVNAPFDLNEVFFEVCDLVSVLCRSKRVRFDYHLGQDLPICRGDKLRLRQVMLNLLNNAIKFTDKGQIDLRMELVKKTASVAELGITINDTGIGMTKSDLQQAFQYFYQGDRGLERKYSGSGLGLSIVKAIVDQYDGKIDIKSKPGFGTKVSVTLKMKTEAQSKKIPGNQKKILQDEFVLVVSHNELEAMTICHQLQKLGAAVEFMASGEEALHRLNSAPLITQALLDVQTSDAGGLQLLQRADFKFDRYQVTILLPALHRRRDIEDSQALGVQRYLYKPFLIEKFLELIGKKEAINLPIPMKAPSVKSLNILVVDDDIDNRSLVEAYVADSPHKVLYAKDGIEALSLAREKRFDLIVMDIEMPGMNGYEVANRIRTLASCRETKILGLSANAFPHNVTQAKEAGFVGYLTKPVRKQVFLNSIVECIECKSFYEASSGTRAESA